MSREAGGVGWLYVWCVLVLGLFGLIAGILISAAGPAYGQSCPPTTTTTEGPHRQWPGDRERAFQREMRAAWREALREQDRTQWYVQGGRGGPPPDFYPEHEGHDGWEE